MVKMKTVCLMVNWWRLSCLECLTVTGQGYSASQWMRGDLSQNGDPPDFALIGVTPFTRVAAGRAAGNPVGKGVLQAV